MDLTMEQYEEILDKMVTAFRLFVDKEVGSETWETGDHEKIDEGLKLFGEYFRSLWN